MAAIPGTVLGAGIVPSDTADSYALQYPTWGAGGLRTVADQTAMLAISTPRLEEGMLVYRQDDQVVYQLQPGFSTPTIVTDWVAFGGGGVTAPADLAYVAIWGSNTAAPERGTMDFPWLTIQAAIDAIAPVPTTAGEYNTTKTIIVMPGSYAETPVVKTRSVFALYGYLVTITGKLTFDLQNSERFGSTITPNLRICGIAASVNGVGITIGDGTDAIVIDSDAGDPITPQGVSFFGNEFVANGAMTDLNNNCANISLLQTHYCQLRALSLSHHLYAGSNNFHVTGTVSLRAFSRDTGSIFAGTSYTVAVASNAGSSRGFRASQFTGAGVTFTGPVDSFVCDGETIASFRESAGVFAGGATVVLYGNDTVRRTPVGSGNYNIGASDCLVAKTAIFPGGDTANLPTAASVGMGKLLIVKDESGTAASNNITIDGNGAETIDGSLTIAITANYGVAKLYCDGSNWFTT